MFKEIGLVFCGGFLTYLSDLKNRDVVAREKILQSLYDLEEYLLGSQDEALMVNHSERLYQDWLCKIQKLIRRMHIEKINLIVSPKLLEQCLQGSVLVFKKYDLQSDNLANHPTQTLAQIHRTWGNSDGRKTKFDLLDQVQKELSGGIIRCSLKRLASFYKEWELFCRCSKNAPVDN